MLKQIYWKILILLAICVPNVPRAAHAHDHHVDDKAMEQKAQFLRDVMDVYRNSNSDNDQDRMTQLSEAIIAALPNPQGENCDGDCQAIQQKNKSILRRVGNVLVGVPKTILLGIFAGVRETVVGNPFTATMNMFSDLQAKGYDQLRDLLYRNGPVTTFFVASLIGLTYIPYTIVTEVLESMVLGLAHVWCTYFQIQYFIAVNYSLKYVESLTILGMYLVSHHVRFDKTLTKFLEDLREQSAYLKKALAKVKLDEQMQEKLDKITKEFVLLKTRSILKGRMAEAMGGDLGSTLPAEMSSSVQAKLWYQSLTFYGDSLKEYVQMQYDDAIHDYKDGHHHSNEDQIRQGFSHLLRYINELLNEIQTFYTAWLTKDQMSLADAQKLEERMMQLAETVLEIDFHHEVDGDFAFKISQVFKIEQPCHKVFRLFSEY